MIVRKKAPQWPEKNFGKGGRGSILFSLAEKTSKRLKVRREKPAAI